jgi:hypothetical protein
MIYRNLRCIDKHAGGFYVAGIMFVVKDILVSDALMDAPFACDLGACLGGCCVQGDSGAPLELDELVELDMALPFVRDRLRPEALDVIDERGAWEETEPGHFATTCVDDAECVFVTYDRGIAKCSLQQAHASGEISFEKPVSCHLYPLRIEKIGEHVTVNYERIGLCQPGVINGERLGIQLSDVLRQPLVRRFGQEWFDEFQRVLAARREEVNVGV